MVLTLTTSGSHPGGAPQLDVQALGAHPQIGVDEGDHGGVEGHGASTTLGAERGSLGLWWERKW